MRIWDIVGRGMTGAACASGNSNHDDDDTAMERHQRKKTQKQCGGEYRAA